MAKRALILFAALALAMAGCGKPDKSGAVRFDGSGELKDPATLPASPAGPAAPAAPGALPAIWEFTAAKVGGGQITGGDLAGKDVAAWFWAPW